MNKDKVSDYAFPVENVDYELEEIELFMEHESLPVALRMCQEFARRYRQELLYTAHWHENHKIGSSA